MASHCDLGSQLRHRALLLQGANNSGSDAPRSRIETAARVAQTAVLAPGPGQAFFRSVPVYLSHSLTKARSYLSALISYGPNERDPPNLLKFRVTPGAIPIRFQSRIDIAFALQSPIMSQLSTFVDSYPCNRPRSDTFTEFLVDMNMFTLMPETYC